MFDNLSGRLQGIFKKLSGQGRVSEAVLQETLREVRLALLEADVHVSVVKQLLEAVRGKALGEEVLRSLSPGQQVVKIVRDELERLLGEGESARLRFASRPPSVILMAGLQGSGKTTTCAKLGVWRKKSGHYPYLVPADVQRPAAVEQLVRIGEAAGLAVHRHDARNAPLDIAREAIAHARRSGFDTVVVDSAGRLHVDEALMDELRVLAGAIEPTEVLFVADAMTGQDAVRSAGDFHRALTLSGVVLTKLDGDARGGAALSIRHVTGVPIKFVGTGERAEEAFDETEARELEKKIRKNELTLEDFRNQLKMVRRMGPLSSVVGMLPGMSHVRESDLDTHAIVRVVAIIDSMTPKERRLPQILDARRKRRVARGSGQSVQEINRLLKQFAQLRRMMKTVKAMGAGKKGGKTPFRGKLPFFGR